MINYFEIKEDCVIVDYGDIGFFEFLNALNIPYKTDRGKQYIYIPKFKVNDCEKSKKSLEEDPQDKEKGHNNGGSTDYYKILDYKDLQDIIEARNMNFAQGNILKAAFCFNVGRHEGTSYERELNKIIYFTERELKRIKNDNN